MSGGNREAAAQMVKVPAILLIVAAILGILFAILGLVIYGTGMLTEMMTQQMIEQGLPAEEVQAQLQAQRMMNTAGSIVNIIASGIILFGALKMKSLSSYPLALTSAIMSIIPCFGFCCLGLPAGIWSLVVLLKPEVKSAFR